MFLAPLLLVVAFQQCSNYNGASDGAIHVCGHAYKVICSRSGSATDCVGTRAGGPAAVDHFEVRDENGSVVFERNASSENIFTLVADSGTGYEDHQLFAVSVERQTRTKGGASSASYIYYFHSTPSGLIAFQPALSCGEGSGMMLSNPEIWPPSGLVLGCEFDAGYFRFTAELEFDLDRYQIVPAPENKTFHVGGSAGMSAQSSTASKLRGYRDHNQNASQFTIAVARGQTTPLLAAWDPIVLRTIGDVGVVSYDPNQLSPQIELKNQTAWIRGNKSFRAIGLHHTGTRHRSD